MKWISVEERLPEENALVLSFSPEIDDSHGPINMGYIIEVGDSFFWRHACKWDNCSFDIATTHWMPLPEGPK
jgi:hypothetical protein